MIMSEDNSISVLLYGNKAAGELSCIVGANSMVPASQRIDDFFLAFPVEEKEIAASIGRQISVEYGLRFEDCLEGVTVERMRETGKSNVDRILLYCLNDSISVVKNVCDQLGVTARIDDRIIEVLECADDRTGREALAHWVFHNALEIQSLKKAFERIPAIGMEIRAWEMVALSYDLDYLPLRDRQVMETRRACYKELVAQHAIKQPKHKLIQANLMMNRANKQFGGYATDLGIGSLAPRF